MCILNAFCKGINLVVKQSVQICNFLKHKDVQDNDKIIYTTGNRQRQTVGITGGVTGAKLYIKPLHQLINLIV